MTRIIAFAGSTRTASLNKMLLRIAVEDAERAGGQVTYVDLRDLPMPLYDGDLEESSGPPPNATRLYELMKEHQGLLLACPEYNSSITGVLKNTIDWVSRPRKGEPPLVAFTGKVAALLSASPGALGGLRGLVHVRSILGNIGVTVIPNQIAVPKAMDAFDADGRLKDERMAKNVASLAAELVETTRKLHA
jgi:chromate reductase